MECFLCGRPDSVKIDEALLVGHYICNQCGEYYIEPGFISRVESFLARFGHDKEIPLKEEMRRQVVMYKKVCFVGTFELPLIHNLSEDYIYLELSDLLDRLGIIVDDNSRGSDYGD